MPQTIVPIITSVAASNAALATQRLNVAHISECKDLILAFDSKSASTQQMQSYAECVNTVYPKETCGLEIWQEKELFIVALVGMVIGAWYSRKEHNDWFDTFMIGLVGFLAAPLVAIFVALIIKGIV